MGAVINMNPELFNGVIAAVPFVDVVTTMLDETIPLTTGEFDEARPETVERLSQMVGDSKFVMIPDAGHFTLNDNRSAVVRAIQEFIESLEK